MKLAGNLKVTHTFVVSVENECIEAHIDEGVARVPLTKYFADPTCQTFFRQPRGWNPDLGRRIADAAATKVGSHYNTGLIVAEAASDTVMGHWFNKLLHSWPNRLLSKVCDRSGQWICSQLVAYALAQQPELQGQGVPSASPSTPSTPSNFSKTKSCSRIGTFPPPFQILIPEFLIFKL